MDESVKELVNDFVEESLGIVETIQNIVEPIEMGEADGKGFVEFALKIDGIMGCAKTLNLDSYKELEVAMSTISKLSEGCKVLGYRASQIQDPVLVKLVAAFMADALEMVENALRDLKKGHISFDVAYSEKIRDRLQWITGKLKLNEEDMKAIWKHFGL